MKPSFTPWWLNPVAIFACISGVLGLAAFLIPETSYQDLWYTPKFLDARGLTAVAAAIAAFSAGAFASGMHFRGWLRSTRAATEPELPAQTVLWLYRAAASLAFAGYFVWAAIAMARGLNLSVLADVVAGKKFVLYGIRAHYLENIPGITTCTQFGVAAAVLGPLAAAQLGWSKTWKSLAALFALATLRAILNTERLALVELALPMIIVVVACLWAPRAAAKPWLRRTIEATPLAGVGALFLVFAGFEYFRSWATYYAGNGLSFWKFAASRLVGYYVTAFNNGAYLAHRLSAPMGLPFFTGQFLWRFPLLKNLTEAFFPVSQLSSTYFDILDSGANKEFNNGGGLFGPLVDFGDCGSVVYWLAAGLLCGWLYRRFKSGSAWGLCLYPVMFLGLVDAPRGLYWAGGRAIPQLCFLMLSAFLLAAQQRRSRRAQDRLEPR